MSVVLTIVLIAFCIQATSTNSPNASSAFKTATTQPRNRSTGPTPETTPTPSSTASHDTPHTPAHAA